GNTPATRSSVAELLAAGLPATLIDADGLNCLAQLEAWPQRLPAQCVLTPHPAEMARLCDLPVDEILERRWDVARTMAAAWQCTVLLKGPYTVIAEPGGWLAVLPIATAALATAGTGDVLAGVIGGLLAQGLDPFRAACAGACLHGTAGLRCAERMGQAGVVASDLLPELPIVQDVLRRERALTA
ncbi:MAG: NAD(P)H-hydrate dehydratase, partial [Caldilineaceae bacterium]|nr:NAD(P)H-hydrate dehydratase [Caldilineaceae bacterium]